MAGNNYKKGRQAEYLCITHLKKEEYFWCQRSYASKGMFDVHGMGVKGGILVQVKRTKRKKIVPSMYREEMEKIQEWVDSIPELPDFIRLEFWVQREGIRGWTKFRFRQGQEPHMFEGNLEGDNK
jgi:hypothetical protein